MTEVAPGVIAFSKIIEVDARHVSNVTGLIDANSEEITMCVTGWKRRNCDQCALASIPCDPSECNNEKDFDADRAQRMALLQMSGGLTLEYHMMWWNGSWTAPTGPMGPMTAFASCTLKGPGFDVALLSVMQHEVSNVHPPRSSYRIVKEGINAMNYFLSLEETEIEAIEKVSSSVDLLEDPISLDWLSLLEDKTCEICDSTFTRAIDLRRHKENMHGKKRKYECWICPKSYSQNGHLREHIRQAHVAQDAFSCTICGKRFGVKHKLQRHFTAVHENRRRFECEVCSKRYKEKSSLKHHQLVHHVHLFEE
mmetsp:Transcript_30211/g.115871  ORF Transcript_30211/g.115871 Transcript_30211/m.115871 type:complete len:310 (-) Transcript_30211:688-1617(-)